MFDYSKQDIVEALNKLKFKKNSFIFVTTSFGFLGKCKDAKNINSLNKLFFLTLKKLFYKNQNLIFPTYSYNCDKNFFDVRKTKSQLGFFSNFLIKQKICKRTYDPFMSVCGFGKKVNKLFQNLPYNSYGRDCIFERLLFLKENVYCLNIGLGSNWIPFIHYLDYLNKVDFRYHKYFNIKIITPKNKFNVKWDYFASKKKNTILSDGYKIGNKAEKLKIYKNINLGRGNIFFCDYKKLFKLSQKLSENNPKITLV